MAFVKRSLGLTALWSSWKRPDAHGDPADPVYLDFQKAFSKIPDQRLLKKTRQSRNKREGPLLEK